MSIPPQKIHLLVGCSCVQLTDAGPLQHYNIKNMCILCCHSRQNLQLYSLGLRWQVSFICSRSPSLSDSLNLTRHQGCCCNKHHFTGCEMGNQAVNGELCLYCCGVAHMNSSIYHISRTLNSEAHNFAHPALNSSSEGIFSCSYHMKDMHSSCALHLIWMKTWRLSFAKKKERERGTRPPLL